MKEKMDKFWRSVFILLLIWSIYHLIRDIFTDILGLHNFIVDFGHRNYPEIRWCSSYCQFLTIPLEIFNIVAISIVLQRNKIGLLGLIVLFTLPIWLFGWLSGEGPYFS